MFIFLLIIVGLALALQWWHKKYALRCIAYQFHTTHSLVAPDEPFELVTALTNPAWLFIPYIRVTEPMPKGIQMGGGHVPDTVGYRDEPRLITRVYLMPRSKLLRRVPVSMPARGCYTFGQTWLWGGDFLGFSDNYRHIKRGDEVVVYPHHAEGVPVHKTMDNFLGDISVRRFIIEDPVLTVGFREYTGREPLKAISWLHTARMGQPMVKIQDYTADFSISVVLNIESEEYIHTTALNIKSKESPQAKMPGIRSEEKHVQAKTPDIKSKERHVQTLERCFSLGHTVCRHLEQTKIKYDFFANFATLGAEYATWKYVSEGLGTTHFHKILEGLGRATHTAKEPFEALISRAAKKSNAKGLIVITTGSKAQAQRELTRWGIRRSLILCGYTE